MRTRASPGSSSFTNGCVEDVREVATRGTPAPEPSSGSTEPGSTGEEEARDVDVRPEVKELEMAVGYGRRLDAPPRILPSGWAALLELFGLR